jgi:hypothetical protein
MAQKKKKFRLPRKTKKRIKREREKNKKLGHIIKFTLYID